MIGEEGKVKLVDFGFAMNLEKKVKNNDEALGTPYYMAPEVLD